MYAAQTDPTKAELKRHLTSIYYNKTFTHKTRESNHLGCTGHR